MRRLTFIAAFALFLAVPLWAQHGGGHGGGGGHASFGGGHSGGFSSHGSFSSGRVTGSSGSAVHSYSRTPSFAQRSYSRGPYLQDGFRGNRFRTYGFRNNCYGYACRNYGYGYGYPWGLGYYDPFLWDWSGDDAAFDNDYNNNLATADQMNQQSLAQQQMMRQEEADGDQDLYASRVAPRQAPNAAASDTQPSSIMPPTVLVFRDQHQQEVQNYAIVGHTLWNFAPGRTQKIPLTNLDLAATEKANDDRGVTFRVPATSEAQYP